MREGVGGSLIALFSSLRDAPGSADDTSTFVGREIAFARGHRVARDGTGQPVVLLREQDDFNVDCPPPVRLEHLSVNHRVMCRVVLHGSVVQQGRFTVLRCTSADAELQGHFLRVTDALVRSLPPSPARAAVRHAVEQLIELFRALSEPSGRSVQGLWAELFLIANASNPVILAEAWHVTPEDLHDFARGAQRIEVKSCHSRLREHHFSLEQLCPPPPTQVVIASLVVERIGGGLSLAELLDQARRSVGQHPDLVLRLEQQASSTLGDGWREGLRERFDAGLALSSLAFYPARSIPIVSPSLPAGVRDVRFVSDLSGVMPAPPPDLSMAGELWAAAFPATR